MEIEPGGDATSPPALLGAVQLGCLERKLMHSIYFDELSQQAHRALLMAVHLP